jgi:hypothetical protein
LTRQTVIRKSTKIALRSGYVDFASQPDFDPNIEEVIEKDFNFDESVSIREYVWNEDDQTFYKEGYVKYKKTPDTVKMTEVCNLDVEDAKTKFEGWILNIENGNTKSVLTKVFPYDIEPIGGQAMIPEGDINWDYGDTVDFLVIPPNDGVIGVLAADATVGQIEIELNSGAIPYLEIGYFLGIGSEDYDYEIKSIDADNNKVTLTEGLKVEKSANNYAKIRVYKLYKWPIFKGEIQDYATLTFGGTPVPAGYTIKIVYNHKNQQSSDYERYIGICYHY